MKNELEHFSTFTMPAGFQKIADASSARPTMAPPIASERAPTGS